MEMDKNDKKCKKIRFSSLLPWRNDTWEKLTNSALQYSTEMQSYATKIGFTQKKPMSPFKATITFT